MESCCENLTALATTIHVVLPTVEDVIQLCRVKIGLIVVYQPSHRIFSNSAQFLFLCIYHFNTSRMLLYVLSAPVHACLNFELVCLNQAFLNLDLIRPTA